VLAAIEVGPQVRAFSHAHRIQIGQGLLNGGFDADGETCLDGRVSVGRPIADGDGLRQAQQIARRQRP
jgi:hypothetical protein